MPPREAATRVSGAHPRTGPLSASAKATHRPTHARRVDGERMSTLPLPQPRRRARARPPRCGALAARPELLVLLALAGCLNLWALDLNGYANDYYAAAVRSMTHVLARVPLRRVRRRRAADGRQAAAGAVGAGAVGAGVRVQLVVAAGAAGADGHRDRRARLRPGAARASAAAAGFAAGPDARADADHGRDLAPQQPGRAARPVHHRARVWAHGSRPARGRQHALAAVPRARSSASASRRRWPRRCWSSPGIVAAWLWVAPRGPAARARASCSRAARRWPRSGSRGRC